MESKNIFVFLFGLSCFLQCSVHRDMFTEQVSPLNGTADCTSFPFSAVDAVFSSRHSVRYSREELLSFNNTASAAALDYCCDSVTDPCVSDLSSSTNDTSLCQRVYAAGVHCRQLPCFHKPARKAHRGRRRKPRLRRSPSLPTKSKPPAVTTSSPVRVAMFNASSVGKAVKRVEIAEFIRDTDLDFLFITETWLKETGDEGKFEELAPAGYLTKSFPRPSRGGGIAVVYKRSLAAHVSFSTQGLPFHHPSFEIVHMKFAVPQSTIHVFVIYRPPPSKKNKLTDSMFFPEFYQLLDMSNGLNGVPLVLGDINFHFNKPNHPSTVKLLDMFDQFRFVQSVNKPTHRLGNTLDWVIHRPEDNIVKSTEVTQALSSDHYCVMCDLSTQRLPPTTAYRTVRCLRAVDRSAFGEDVQSALHEPISAESLDACLRATLDTHAPAKHRKVRPDKSAPWYQAIHMELRQAKQDRRLAERRWLRTGLMVHNQMYKSAKRAVTKLVQKAKTDYIRTQIADCSNSSQLFSLCGKLCGRSKQSPLPTVYPSSRLPDIFCDYFVTKVTAIRSELDSLPSNQYSCDVAFTDNQFASFSPITESQLKKIIMKCKPTTCPLDPIPTPLLIDCLDVLLPSLTQIINDSLRSGIVPSLFKAAVVKPLLKKPSLDQNNFKNYRPVSNLPFLSKVLEKVVLEQLFAYLTDNNLINPSQSAYRPHHSTETALIKVTNDILFALDRGDISVLTLLDLSAAFDTIDHSILLQRLNSLYGISGSALDWFCSYLSDRSLSVVVNDSASKHSDLSFGVPQGSVLGPLLFILYTKPLSSLISSHSVSSQSFADDTQLYSSSTPDQSLSMAQTIENCIHDVKLWMTDNKLKLNDDKTEALLLTKKKVDRNTLPDSIQVGHVNIPFSHYAKNLGYTVASDMSLNKHVSLICRSAFYELHRISLIRPYLTTQLTKTLICALVLSRLDYCNALLAGCPDYLIEKIQKVQNSAARLVFKAKKRDHVTPLLKDLHWLPIQQRIKYKLSTLCFNYFSATAPAYISDLLTPYAPSRLLRSSSDYRVLCIPQTDKKTYGHRTFAYTAATQWNSLPSHLRHSDTVHTFKKALKTHLFKEYFD